ncbi:uncharacterized protein PV07_06272 [Cladophialophora immunda]|uniref:Major facilitator superfamily (MFS) profile domain-containing protein n=1 Tax=Cladophialophora immunda TaxID=569365 RepID=A0A0D2CHH5_9EURO|nr:uncharacterized protein PV07_06272 [Cladophialophora immunda]KIW30533.1 hypothetical protein PV07_06272 [Cladophialophora immunda]
MDLLKGGTAVIIGAASGIGQAAAIAFARDGCKKVMIGDINVDGLAERKRLIQEQYPDTVVETAAIDVVDESSVEAFHQEAASRFGRIDFAANSAGYGDGIVACRAQTMNTLIGANVMLGLSAGVHTCYALIIGEICSHKHKFIGVVLVLVPNVVATGFGAYIALDLAHNASWRWVYYIFIMMMSASIALQYVFYRPPNFRQLHGDDRTRWEEVKRIDWVGLFFLVAGLVLFLLGISWGGQPLPWSSTRVLGLVISGGITLIVFGLWEGFSNTTNPLVPMHFFKDLRGFVVLCLISSVCGTVYLATAIIWPSQVAVIYSGTITSWQHIAWASLTNANYHCVRCLVGMIFIGPFVGIIKHVRIQFIVLMSICVAFLGGLVSCNPHNFGQSAAFFFLAAMPLGIMEMTARLLVQMDSNDADLGTVFSIVFLIKSASGSIFTSVFIAILNNKLPAELKKYVIPAALQAGLPQSSLTALAGAVTSGNSTLLTHVPGMDTAIEAAVGSGLATAYAAAYAYVYYAAVALPKNYDPLFNDHISRKIYKSGQNDAPTQ